MKNGIVTAALVIIGFTVPLALAWHRGDFGVDEPEVVASAPVRLASAAPVEATAMPAQANADSQPMATAQEAKQPSLDEPPSALSQEAPAQGEGNSSASDANPAPSEDNAPVDEAREEIRANRRH